MNTQRYRLIYNRIRNCLMAVAETVTCQGKKAEQHMLHHPGVSPIIWTPLN